MSEEKKNQKCNRCKVYRYPSEFLKKGRVLRTCQVCRDICSKSRNKNKRFAPPTVEDVAAYCQERRNFVDPQGFIDHYETNGWVQGNGKKKVVCWKACVRTWEKNSRGAKSDQPTFQRPNLLDAVNNQ